MTNRETLYLGLSRAAWGYFFLYFDFKLGTISVLPSFAGFLLFLSAIKLLTEERRDLELLRPLGIMLTLWHLANWLANTLDAPLDGKLPIVELIVSLASIYFHFQMITDFAALAAKYQQPDQTLDRRLLKWRTRQTVLLTAFSLLPYPLAYLPQWQEPVLFVTALAGFITSLCIMFTLFDLRRIFKDSPEESSS